MIASSRGTFVMHTRQQPAITSGGDYPLAGRSYCGRRVRQIPSVRKKAKRLVQIAERERWKRKMAAWKIAFWSFFNPFEMRGRIFLAISYLLPLFRPF